jgi:hypothetical protein
MIEGAARLISDRELGKLNFEAYCFSVGGKTYDGKPIPAWGKLSVEVQEAWIEGAAAVRKALEK